MSSLVETSGRSSAHVSVLDAFQAAKVCTSPTALQLHTLEDDSDRPPPKRQLHQPAWQDLADFIYGPNWQQPAKNKNDDEEQLPQSLGQGKKMVRPEETKKTKAGWDAPYLDEVPPFPEATANCANPHKLPPSVALSLYPQPQDELEEAVEQDVTLELKSLPDDIFVTPWEEAGSTTAKRPREEEEEGKEDENGPPTKRARINDQDTTKEPPPRAPKPEKTSYIPTFYPPFPQTQSSRLRRTVVDHDNKAVPLIHRTLPEEKQPQNDSMLNVRSSLVKMKTSQYWGSGWDAAPEAASLQVPPGRQSGGSATDTPSVVPLGRASGSRVSRILEGSMDPFH